MLSGWRMSAARKPGEIVPTYLVAAGADGSRGSVMMFLARAATELEACGLVRTQVPEDFTITGLGLTQPELVSEFRFPADGPPVLLLG